MSLKMWHVTCQDMRWRWIWTKFSIFLNLYLTRLVPSRLTSIFTQDAVLMLSCLEYSARHSRSEKMCPWASSWLMKDALRWIPYMTTTIINRCTIMEMNKHTPGVTVERLTRLKTCHQLRTCFSCSAVVLPMARHYGPFFFFFFVVVWCVPDKLQDWVTAFELTGWFQLVSSTLEIKLLEDQFIDGPLDPWPLEPKLN